MLHGRNCANTVHCETKTEFMFVSQSAGWDHWGSGGVGLGSFLWVVFASGFSHFPWQW